jgi:hypothetical protein
MEHAASEVLTDSPVLDERASEAPPAGQAENEEPANFADTLALLRRKGAEKSDDEARMPTQARYLMATKLASAVAAVVAGWLGTAALVSYWSIDSIYTGQIGNAQKLTVTSANRITGHGRNAVQVGGSITNRSSYRQALETLEFVLTNADGGEMGSWRFRPAVQFLEGGQTIRFTSAKGDVPALALGVEIRFASERKKFALGITTDADRPQQEDRGAVQRRGNSPEKS